MSAFLHDVAGAALPVAVGLAILAAAARAALWAQVDDARVQRLARGYAAPLGTWCLGAAAITVLAVGAAGDATVLSLALPIALGVGAMLLRSTPEPAEPRAARRSAAPVRPATEPTQRPAAPEPAQQSVAPGGSLWIDGDEARAPGGLWSRA